MALLYEKKGGGYKRFIQTHKAKKADKTMAYSTKNTKHKTQCRKLKTEQNEPHQKLGLIISQLLWNWQHNFESSDL